MNDLKFSILIPTYNGADVVGDTLRSLLSQSFQNFEIIIQDDVSKDNIEEVVASFKDDRIRFYRNERNLGYPGNLEAGRQKATGDILYLMAQDDILGVGALEDTYRAFKISDDIGAVTRPYFWFDRDIRQPVRETGQLNPDQDEIVRITDDYHRIMMVIWTIGQLSGLGYRIKYMDMPFHPDIFPAHAYPFVSIMKKHPVVFLKSHNLAVRITSSQTRKLSSIYDRSPMQSWVDMFNTLFCEPELHPLRDRFIRDYVAGNFVGLVQIRNYARYRYLWREIYYLIKYRPDNLLRPQFWFFSLGCALMPPALLIRLVDEYKRRIVSPKLKGIPFEYKL